MSNESKFMSVFVLYLFYMNNHVHFAAEYTSGVYGGPAIRQFKDDY